MKRKRLQPVPEEQLQLEPVPARPGSALLDWEHFEQRTDQGTLLVSLTLEQAQMDLDQWAFQERTGVIMPKGQRLHMVGWKSVLEKVGMSVGSIDRKKLLSALEGDLAKYEEAQASKRSSSMTSTIDPAELKSGIKNLHATFQAHAKSNELEIGALAMAYTMDHSGEFEENKGLLRSIINHPSSMAVFSIGAGGAPKVRRLQSATGKNTGLEAFDKTRKPRKSKT